MKEEHTRLLVDLQTMSVGRTSLNAVFEEILRVFEYHLDREEETTLPLLAFLEQRSTFGSFQKMNPEILKSAWDLFKNEVKTMLTEHRDILRLIEKAEELPGFSQNAYARDVSEAIRNHIRLEEKILYPAAMAAGELLELIYADSSIIFQQK